MGDLWQMLSPMESANRPPFVSLDKCHPGRSQETLSQLKAYKNVEQSIFPYLSQASCHRSMQHAPFWCSYVKEQHAPFWCYGEGSIGLAVTELHMKQKQDVGENVNEITRIKRANRTGLNK